MKYRELGKTNIKVSELSLGGLFLSTRGADFETAKKATLKAISLGVNYVDTAPTYRDSEEVLGNILEGNEQIIISTKVGGYPKPFDAKSKDDIFQSVEDSLKKLKRDYIDILMIHEPDRPGQYDWWSEDTDKLYGPVIDAIESLKDRGLIKYTGVGGTTAYELARVIELGDFDVVLTAFQYSLLWREAQGSIIPAAKSKNMGIIAGSPLQHGALAVRYDDEINSGAPWLSPPRRAQFKRLYALLDDLNMSVVEASLRFLFSDEFISTVLVGVRSENEITDNVRIAEKGPLPADILEEIDDIANMVPFRPFEEPYSMPFKREYKGPGGLR